MSSGMHRKGAAWLASLAAALAVAGTAHGAASPEQKCQAGKNSASGKFVACMTKAEKGLVISGDIAAYGDSQAKCHEKLSSSWNKLEEKALDAGVSCPSTGDQSAVGAFLSSCVQSLADAMGGGALGSDPVTCEADLATCNGDLSTCNGGLSACTSDVSTCNGNVATCNGDVTTCNGNVATCSASLATCNTDLGTCTTDLATASASEATCNGNLSACNGDLSVCTADLAACNAAAGAGLPETGQVLCYNTSHVATACASTGQDGQFQAGVARTFTDNNDGTITDHATGLMWERQTDDSTIHDVDNAYTWANAFSKIATLNASSFAGYADWRVPNIVELASLRDFSASNPSTFGAFNNNCTTNCSACSCTRYINDNFRYWSSTYLPGNAAAAEQVLFGYGRVTAAFKTDARLVRAVRGGS